MPSVAASAGGVRGHRHGELERVIRDERLDFVQLNYFLAERDAERRLLPLARDRGIAVPVNRPYAEGVPFRRVLGRLPDAATRERMAAYLETL